MSVQNNDGIERDRIVDKITLLLRERSTEEIGLIHNLIQDVLKVFDFNASKKK